MTEQAPQAWVELAYRLAAQRVGRHGLRWAQAKPGHLALGYDPLRLARRRLPRCWRLAGAAVPLAWIEAAAPMQAQAWPQVRLDDQSGTLAAVLRSRDAPEALFGLTAGHVLNSGQFGARLQLAADGIDALQGQLYDWMPMARDHQSVELDAALFSLPPQALGLLADRLDWPLSVGGAPSPNSRMALLSRQHRIGGILQTAITAEVQAGAHQYTILHALSYRLDADGEPGDSGAPLWDDADALIGLHVGANPADRRMGVGTPIARVLDWAEMEVVLRSQLPGSFMSTLPASATELPASDDIDIVVRTVWGEARGEGADGMRAVAQVVFNRHLDRRWRGQGGLAAICLQPAQFSCWNAGDRNREPMMNLATNSSEYLAARQAVETAQAASRLQDTTRGATHYHATSVVPRWALVGEFTVQIGRHRFYKSVP